MLFSRMFRKVDPNCVYCRHGTRISEREVVCVKRGVAPVEHHCRSFRYDPLKRIPPRPAVLRTSGLSEADFSLYDPDAVPGQESLFAEREAETPEGVINAPGIDVSDINAAGIDTADINTADINAPGIDAPGIDAAQDGMARDTAPEAASGTGSAPETADTGEPERAYSPEETDREEDFPEIGGTGEELPRADSTEESLSVSDSADNPETGGAGEDSSADEVSDDNAEKPAENPALNSADTPNSADSGTLYSGDSGNGGHAPRETAKSGVPSARERYTVSSRTVLTASGNRPAVRARIKAVKAGSQGRTDSK